MTRQLLALVGIACATVSAGQAGVPSGLYLMTRYWSGSGLETAAYWFQGGVVVINPIGSAQSLDVQAERAMHPKEVGTFRMQGDQMVAVFPGGNRQSKVEPDKACFAWDGGIFCPVEIFKPGTTLEGTFAGGASVGGGAVMSSTDITFHRDGTYQRESAASFKTGGGTSTVSGGSTGADRGRYRIDGVAMHIMPEGGGEKVVSTFPWDDETKGPAPRRLYFGGGMMKRIR